MKLSQISRADLDSRLQSRGLVFRAGRFSVRLITGIDSVVDALSLVYGDHESVDSDFADFTVRLQRSGGLRRVFRPQAVFSLDGAKPFSPLPLAHAFPLLEWGLNWCVSNHCHQYLIVHAAVVEKHGRALILPGAPGSGKSTLCALLTGIGGWRLLSDELTLIDPVSGSVHANPRPISLKNESIDIIRRELPGAVLSPSVTDTLKGTVSHLQPAPCSVDRVHESAAPALVVFPRFTSRAKGELLPMPRGEAFIRMADNAFNYSILGLAGFRALAALLDRSECYEYPNGGDVDHALATMDKLVAT